MRSRALAVVFVLITITGIAAGAAIAAGATAHAAAKPRLVLHVHKGSGKHRRHSKRHSRKRPPVHGGQPPHRPSAPRNTQLPVITGLTAAGSTLSASTGSWSGSPTSYSYQWRDCDTAGNGCSNITGDTTSHYKLASTDVGHSLDVIVTAASSAGEGSAASPPTAVVTVPPPVPSVYVAQNATGAGNGSSCANARPAAWFDTASSWGTGAGRIGPGAVVGLCGTIGSPLTAYGSGVAGKPITIYWEPGAALAEAVCPVQGTGCFNTNGRSYLTLNGGTNGTILSTANGTLLANHRSSVVGISALNCTGCTIQNLNISDMYVHVYSQAHLDDCAPSVDSGIIASGSNLTIADNTMHDDRDAVDDDMNPTDANVRLYGNSIYNDDGGILLAPTAAGHNLGPVYIYDNHMSNWSNWDTGDGQDCYHHDGIHCFTGNDAGPSHWLGVYIYDNVFDGATDSGMYGDSDNMTAEVFIQGSGSTECSDASSPFYVFDNLFQSSYYVYNGLLSPYSGEQFIYNNTFIGGTSSQGAGSGYGGNGGAGAFIDNVVTNAHELMYTGGGNPAAIFSGGLDYNLYADGGTSPFMCPNGSFVSFSSWKSCVGGDYHSSYRSSAALSASGAPQAGSPATNEGKNLTSLCTGALAPLCNNISGIRRPTSGSWSVGAY
jgi:hypothetical protein